MIIVNTGNGKGKTTAALGQVVRSVGEGKKVLMIQWHPFDSLIAGNIRTLEIVSTHAQ